MTIYLIILFSFNGFSIYLTAYETNSICQGNWYTFTADFWPIYLFITLFSAVDRNFGPGYKKSVDLLTKRKKKQFGVIKKN